MWNDGLSPIAIETAATPTRSADSLDVQSVQIDQGDQVALSALPAQPVSFACMRAAQFRAHGVQFCRTEAGGGGQAAEHQPTLNTAEGLVLARELGVTPALWFRRETVKHVRN